MFTHLILFSRDLDEPWRRDEPCSFSSAPELSAPKSISDSGKHSPGIGRRAFKIHECFEDYILLLYCLHYLEISTEM